MKDKLAQKIALCIKHIEQKEALCDKHRMQEKLLHANGKRILNQFQTQLMMSQSMMNPMMNQSMMDQPMMNFDNQLMMS